MNGYARAQQEIERARQQITGPDVDAAAALDVLRRTVEAVRDALTGPDDAGLLAA